MEIFELAKNVVMQGPVLFWLGAAGATILIGLALFTRAGWLGRGILFLAGVSLASQLSLSSISSVASLQPQRALELDPTMALLMEHHPELRDQLDELQKELDEKDADEDERREAEREFGTRKLQAYVLAYLSRAPDDALVSFTQTTADATRAMRERGDEACYYWLAGTKPPKGSDVSMELAESEMRPISESMAYVIESTLDDPHPRPNKADAAKLLRAFADSYQRRHGPKAVQRLTMLSRKPTLGTTRLDVCEAFENFYEDALALPEPERSDLLRAIYTNI